MERVPRTKTGFADLLHELGCLHEKMIELRRGDALLDDPQFEVDCIRRANALKVASEHILTHDAPAELTEDSPVLYIDLVGINNSVIALMEEYIANGEIGLLNFLRAHVSEVTRNISEDVSEAGNLLGLPFAIIKGACQGVRMADLDERMADLDAMDEAGELYTGTEDEKDKDAEWFRGLSKQWRLKLKNYHEEQMKKYLREVIFGTDSTPAPQS